MRKEFKSVLSLVTLIVLLVACSEDVPYKGMNEQSQNDIIQLAKDLVDNQGSTIPMPVNGGENVESRSAMLALCEATPLWNKVKSYNIDGMQVLIVELQTAEKVL